MSALTAGGLLWKEVSAYLIRRKELTGQERSKDAEVRRQDEADDFTRREAFFNRIEAELKECREGRAAATAMLAQQATDHRSEIDQLREEHKSSDRAAWKELRRIQAKNMQLESDVRDTKQKVTVNALTIGSVKHEISSVAHEVETVKKRTGLHLDQLPGEPDDPTHVPPVIGEP